MLYNLHEMNRLMLSPLSYTSALVAETFTNPFSPYSYLPGSRRFAARFDLFNRLGKEYEKPQWRINEVEINGEMATVTTETVVNKPFCNLVHFKRSASKYPGGDPTVLIVAPYSGHHATLLRDTVRRMLTDFDVYVTDWLDARTVPVNQGAFDLDEYVYYIISFLHALNKRVHVMAVCQPAVPVMGAVSLMSKQKDPLVPLSMIHMGGPIDTRQSPTVVNNLADRHSLAWFETQMIQRVPTRYPGAGRLVYPGFMQLMGFIAMNPRSHLKSHHEYYLDLMRGNEPEAEKHRTFYDEYNAVCDLPAEFYLQTVKVVFQDHALPNGTWKVGSHLIEPSAIDSTALLTVEGELDDITGIGQTSAALEMTPNIPDNKKKSFIAEGSGHYGIFSGRRWRENVFPVVAEFIQEAQLDEEEQLLARLRAEVEEAIRKENEAKARAAARKKAREDAKAAKDAEKAKIKAREDALEKAKQEALEAAEVEAKLLKAAEAAKQAEAEAKAIAEAEEKARLEAEKLAQEKAAAEAKKKAEEQTKAAAKAAAEAKKKAQEQAQAAAEVTKKAEAEAKARALAEEKAKLAAEQLAQEKAAAKATETAAATQASIEGLESVGSAQTAQSAKASQTANSAPAKKAARKAAAK